MFQCFLTEKRRMAEEDSSLSNSKDTVTIKSQKKQPCSLRMIVLILVMISGVYIFLVCLKQKESIIRPNLMKPKVFDPHCPHPRILQSADSSHIHYPEPSTYTRNECKCTRVVFFTILSMQRSGSGWFETLLNSHTNVSSNGEIFSVKERRANMSSISMTMDKVYNLDWFSSASKNECTAAVGFKWMLNQGLMQNHEEILSYFNRKGVSVIFLFRRNLLRQWVSVLGNNHDRQAKQLNGTHKSHVHTKYEADVLARYKPMIDPTLLIPTLKKADKLTADALKYFKSTRHIVLYYEDLVQNQTKLQDVLEFLRVPKSKLYSQHVKIHSKPLSDQVDNWDAVSNALNGTEYESFLHSDYGM